MEILDGQITKNFNIKEFQCRHCGQVLLNGSVLTHIIRLQIFRDWYNRPINVNSGYRCAVHNKAVGGVKNSYHMKGIATDFSLPIEFYKFTNERKSEFITNVINKWRELGGGTVCVYDTFIHLDSKEPPFKIYDYRKSKLYVVSQ